MDTTRLRRGLYASRDADRIVRLTRELTEARADQAASRQALTAAHKRLALYDRLSETRGVEIVPWARPKKPKGLFHATPGLLFSDQHYDEVVDPHQVEGLNAYNREIAVVRTKMLFEHTVQVARHYLAGVTYDGFLLQLGGDTFSGTIHEELTQTNEDVVFGSVLFWQVKIAEFIEGLAEEFGKVHVVGVSGNHGRQTRKPRAKFYAKDNLDWLLYQEVRRELRKDDRVTWNIPDSRDAETVVYQTRLRTTHGDKARGGSGISGKKVPLALLEHRMTRRVMQAKQDPFDCVMHGHWHEYDPGERMLGNGSMKGIDEFSLGGEFGCEEPKQGFYLITPEHGVSLKAPIYCRESRKKEKW